MSKVLKLVIGFAVFVVFMVIVSITYNWLTDYDYWHVHDDECGHESGYESKHENGTGQGIEISHEKEPGNEHENTHEHGQNNNQTHDDQHASPPEREHRRMSP